MQDQARSALTKALQLEEVYDFSGAKTIYQEILEHADDESTLEKARWRMEDMDDLIAEKTSTGASMKTPNG